MLVFRDLEELEGAGDATSLSGTESQGVRIGNAITQEVRKQVTYVLRPVVRNREENDKPIWTGKCECGIQSSLLAPFPLLSP